LADAPFSLEHVIVFVFDLPPSSPCLRNVHNIVSGQAMIGNTTIMIELFARGGIDNRDVKPMNGQGIVPTTQHVVEVAYLGHFREAPIPVAHFTCGYRVGSLPKCYALIEFGMRVGFARQDEIAPML